MNGWLSKMSLAGLLLIMACPAVAQDGATREIDPDKVLAYSGDVELSQLEIDAAFSKLPESERLAFIRDGGKVDQLIRVLLRRKAIAADAVRAGYDQDPVIAARVELEAEKELAEAWFQNIMDSMPSVDYELLAREDFLA